jgi:hypothetical protein
MDLVCNSTTQDQLSYSDHYYLSPTNVDFYPLSITEEDQDKFITWTAADLSLGPSSSCENSVCEQDEDKEKSNLAHPDSLLEKNMSDETEKYIECNSLIVHTDDTHESVLCQHDDTSFSPNDRLEDLIPDFINDEWMELSDDSNTTHDMDSSEITSSGTVDSPRFEEDIEFIQTQSKEETHQLDFKETPIYSNSEELVAIDDGSLKSTPSLNELHSTCTTSVSVDSGNKTLSITQYSHGKPNKTSLSKRKKSFCYTSVKKRKLFHSTWIRELWTVDELRVLLNLTIEQNLVDTLPHAAEIKTALLSHDPTSSKTLIQIKNKRHAIFYRLRRGMLSIQDQLESMINELVLLSQHPSHVHRSRPVRENPVVVDVLDTTEIVFIDATPNQCDMSTLKEFTIQRPKLPLKERLRRSTKCDRLLLALENNTSVVNNNNNNNKLDELNQSDLTTVQPSVMPNSPYPSSSFLDFVLPPPTVESPCINIDTTTSTKSRYPIVIHLPPHKPWAFHCFNAK